MSDPNESDKTVLNSSDKSPVLQVLIENSPLFPNGIESEIITTTKDAENTDLDSANAILLRNVSDKELSAIRSTDIQAIVNGFTLNQTTVAFPITALLDALRAKGEVQAAAMGEMSEDEEDEDVRHPTGRIREGRCTKNNCGCFVFVYNPSTVNPSEEDSPRCFGCHHSFTEHEENNLMTREEQHAVEEELFYLTSRAALKNDLRSTATTANSKQIVMETRTPAPQPTSTPTVPSDMALSDATVSGHPSHQSTLSVFSIPPTLSPVRELETSLPRSPTHPSTKRPGSSAYPSTPPPFRRQSSTAPTLLPALARSEHGSPQLSLPPSSRPTPIAQQPLISVPTTAHEPHPAPHLPARPPAAREFVLSIRDQQRIEQRQYKGRCKTKGCECDAFEASSESPNSVDCTKCTHCAAFHEIDRSEPAESLIGSFLGRASAYWNS
ncbi:hypothetical protein BJ508DRAFT_418746 [Ascobolus immersus RN42]|uniref:Uncharacterized protein n=1 Tax=Ascobolus immersus RN42 TaxID=1160509 RepID=A0A3N4HQU8_ASCIM|nr:hypothetical protein BJ508DRAFT_418746 [Ascobolus immersus RN42]